jgi:hypothetical protein
VGEEMKTLEVGTHIRVLDFGWHPRDWWNNEGRGFRDQIRQCGAWVSYERPFSQSFNRGQICAIKLPDFEGKKSRGCVVLRKAKVEIW